MLSQIIAGNETPNKTDLSWQSALRLYVWLGVQLAIIEERKAKVGKWIARCVVKECIS